MHSLDCLLQQRFVGLVQRENDWVFDFDGQYQLVVECLWRLIEDNRIRLTSLDHGQQFGLPAPVDAVQVIESRLMNVMVVDVNLHDGTLDLRISFENGQILEVIPDSSGYEAWNFVGAHQQIVAVGDGDLAIVQVQPENRAEHVIDSFGSEPYAITMSTVEEIADAIRKLPDEGLASFRAWFAEFDAAAWDHQFERDVAEGRLQALAEEALRDSREGRCTDL